MKRNLIYGVSSVVLFVLYRGMAVLSRRDSRVKQELMHWPKGLALKLVCGPKGPVLTLIWDGNRLLRGHRFDRADITMTFKSPEKAFRVLTGQRGISDAYARHDFFLKGDIHQTMRFMRAVEITEAYLFPKIMTRRILKRVPKKELPTPVVYARLFFPD